MNFVIDKAKELNPTWLIFDDFDCVPNYLLNENARYLFDECIPTGITQVNVFRLYLWGDDEFFPKMNGDFDSLYRSIWAWRPKDQQVSADVDKHHGTLIGTQDEYAYPIELPMCLLHKSWHPDTIEQKMKRQNAVGIEMHHPLEFAGEPVPLPEWARE